LVFIQHLVLKALIQIEVGLVLSNDKEAEGKSYNDRSHNKQERLDIKQYRGKVVKKWC